MLREEAEAIIRGNGWLAGKPADFQNEVLRNSVLVHYAAPQSIYHAGDEPGGIYGLVSGNVTIISAPLDVTPKITQSGLLGHWTGEMSFFTRQPRRIELQVRVPTWVMHLPLSQMDRMVYQNPAWMSHFNHILIMTIDTMIRIISDLQQLDPAQRIATTLCRAIGHGSNVVALSQTELGEMAGCSRRQVSRVIHQFADKGWVKQGYRDILILNPQALIGYAREE